MRYLEMTMIALAAVVVAAVVAGHGWAQPIVGNPQGLVGAEGVLQAAGNGSQVPVILAKKGGHGHGQFKSGFRGWYGWGPGWYGGYGYSYPYGYYGGSYLDTPTRTCVWNGYEYTCYTFPDEM